MAALNFPNSPSLNEIYSFNGKSWRWDGYSWKTYFILDVPSGGTGFTGFNLGDLLVGAGTSFIKLAVGNDNYVLKANSTSGSGLTWAIDSGGIASINGIATVTQLFGTGTSGDFFNISSVGSSHTFNIPIAGSGSTGLISTLAQSFAGVKTFTNDLVISSSTVSASTSTGALTVSGGVGIGGSLFLTNSLPSSLSGVVVNNGVISSGSWAGSLITGFYGGTGRTNINAPDAFLSSDSAGTALTYRSFNAGAGISFSVSPSAITFSATNTLSGSGTSAYVPLWTNGGASLTNSIMLQTGDIVIVNGSIKAQTKSFKIQHPLRPDMYLEHGSLEGPEHGIYQRGRASGYDIVEVELPDYFHALSEKDISVILTPRINCNLFVCESNSFSFKVKRINSNFLRKQYIEFDYFVIGERTDIKLIVEQPKF